MHLLQGFVRNFCFQKRADTTASYPRRERERERGAAMYVAAVVACVVTAGPDAVQEKALLAMLFVKLSS